MRIYKKSKQRNKANNAKMNHNNTEFNLQNRCIFITQEQEPVHEEKTYFTKGTKPSCTILREHYTAIAPENTYVCRYACLCQYSLNKNAHHVNFAIYLNHEKLRTLYTGQLDDVCDHIKFMISTERKILQQGLKEKTIKEFMDKLDIEHSNPKSQNFKIESKMQGIYSYMSLTLIDEREKMQPNYTIKNISTISNKNNNNNNNNTWTCTCKGFYYHRTHCKHIKHFQEYEKMLQNRQELCISLAQNYFTNNP